MPTNENENRKTEPKKDRQKRIPAIIDYIKDHATLNIGTILFGLLFFYIVVTVVIYLTSSHYRTYQVVTAALSRNENYTALALHSDKVVSTDIGGYMNYYAREGTKLNASGIVYGISASPSETEDTQLSTEDLTSIRKLMSSYSYGYESSNFNSVYSFKSELEGSILQYQGVESTGKVASFYNTDSSSSEEESDSFEESDDSTVTLGNMTLVRTDEDGIILYSSDGFESVTEDDLTEEMFSMNNYHKEDLKTRDAVVAGQDVYTIINSEKWSIYIPLTAKQAAQLADRTSVKVKFLKDNITQNGSFSIVEIEDGEYAKIDFNNGLIRYATDRFLDIELVTNTQTGLKLPLSAITQKEFYLIPTDYQTKGGNDSSAGFLVQSDDGSTTEFVSATIYAEKDDMYYVEKSDFEAGDVVVKPDSSDHYTIKDTGNLEGVYCVNEGYAKFRRISIIDQNDEYCIVEKGTSYGLSQYDNIVFDSSNIKEEDIIVNK